MKILQISPYPPSYLGGSEIFCKNLSINLKKFHNIDSVILASDIFRKNLKTDIIDGPVKVVYKKFYLNLLGKNPIVNVFNYIKKHYREFDIIHAHSYIFFTSFQASMLRKILKFPLVLHIHGGVQTFSMLKSSLIERIQLLSKQYIFDKFIGKFIIEGSDAIISVSNSDLKYLELIYDISKIKRFWIPNAVDIKKFERKSNLERKYITFIGRLSYIKGLDIFIKMIEILHEKNKDLKFLIVGNGPLKNLVDEAKKKLPITHVLHYPYEKIQDIYKMSKLLILTSRYEGLPTTILESLASKTPVIASNVGGVSEIIKDGKNGLLYDLNKYVDVIDKIIELIDNHQKLEKFGINGFNLIKKDFSWESVTQKIKDVYEEVLSVV